MSYEGRIQKWCVNGHYSICFDDLYWPTEREDFCGVCKEDIVFKNSVDNTNGEEVGYITPELMKDAEHCTCNCGNYHQKTAAIYKIPIKEAK